MSLCLNNALVYTIQFDISYIDERTCVVLGHRKSLHSYIDPLSFNNKPCKAMCWVQFRYNCYVVALSNP